MLWGASFLFMRVGAPQFDPIALIGLRVAIAALCLWPLWLASSEAASLRRHALPMATVGICNSALPFVLLAYASLSLTAGFTALINATVPLWAALVGMLWLRDRLTPRQWIGLLLGVIGMAVLTWGKVTFREGGSALAIMAGLLATLSYGFSSHFARQTLAGVAPLAIATGSQTCAAIALAPLTLAFWPTATPSGYAWLALILLATLSTALAYILYFRLIAHLGGQRASTVTFLIPVFAAGWGGIFLGEVVTPPMLLGGAIILVGTALTLGIARTSRRQRS